MSARDAGTAVCRVALQRPSATCDRIREKPQKCRGGPLRACNDLDGVFPAGGYSMKMFGRAAMAALLSTLATPLAAAPVTFDFRLATEGYVQDSPVASDLFADQGLTLSAGSVTACGGNCLTTPAFSYDGDLTGVFDVGYGDLTFVMITGLATIDLFGENGLITTLTNPGGGYTAIGNLFGLLYTYSGTQAVTSFTMNLNYEAAYGIVADNPAEVPEPAALSLVGLGLVGVALRRRRRA